MAHCDYNSVLAKTVIILVNILITVIGTVRIEKLVISEVVQSGCSAVFDCQYSADGLFTVQWLYNRSETPIYQWRQGNEPKVSSLLDGRFNITSLASDRLALRIVNLVPELSGEHTCRVSSDNSTELPATRTKSMLVYSPEKDFILQFHQQHDIVEIKCIARGLYPQPDFTIELNRLPFPKLQQRVWRSSGLLYDAECTALLPVAMTADNPEVTCRLQLPQAGYTAIKRELLHNSRKKSESSSTRPIKSGHYILAVIITVISKFKNI